MEYFENKLKHYLLNINYSTMLSVFVISFFLWEFAGMNKAAEICMIQFYRIN